MTTDRRHTGTDEAVRDPAGRGATDRDAPDRTDAPSEASTAEHEAAIAELEDRWRRALADLDNLRKRYALELARERAAERDRVSAEWLAVLDNLERALAHAGSDPDAIVAGVRAVRDQALEVLARLGYAREDRTGVPFDPARHEVVSLVDDPDAEPGTVVHVIRPGYAAADRVLRPASVAVARRE